MWSVMAFLNRDEQAQLRISKTQAARVPRGTPGTSDIGLHSKPSIIQGWHSNGTGPRTLPNEISRTLRESTAAPRSRHPSRTRGRR